MRWAWILAAALVLAWGAVACQRASSGQVAPMPDGQMGVSVQGQGTSWQGVTVTGVGRVSARPDMAVVSLGISARGNSVAQVMEEGTQAQERLLSVLRDQGVAQEDMRTTSLSLSQERPFPVPPVGESSPPQAVTYTLSITTEVKVRNLARLSPLLAAAARQVGDPLQIHFLQLTISDPAPLQAEARRRAMADARARAQQLAAEGGITLGQPLAIVEGGVEVPMPRVMEAGGDGRLATGPLDIVVTVSVVYAIK